MCSHDFGHDSDHPIDESIAKQIAMATSLVLTDAQVVEAIKRFIANGRMLTESDIDEVIGLLK
jgi:hypothetical protein